jgi:glycosyltransferase involved in cell wall biosynthesis
LFDGIQQSAMAKTKFSVLIHTCNDALQLGRTLDSLRPSDDVVVVDHASTDDTVKVAREHGARIVNAVNGVDHGAYVQDARNDWILCLSPDEALGDDLEASLFEWRDEEHHDAAMGFNVAVREQNGHGWKITGPQMRLANRKQVNWTGDFPPENPAAPALQGHIVKVKAAS